MAVQKLKLSRPKRLQERLLKLAKEANSMAELLAETVVSVQDVSRAAVRLAEEIGEGMKS